MTAIYCALAGNSSVTRLTINTNQTNLNLRTWALSNTWNGSDSLEVTINSGVHISSNAVGTPALTINGAFPGGVRLINNGEEGAECPAAAGGGAAALWEAAECVGDGAGVLCVYGIGGGGCAGGDAGWGQIS